MQMDAGVDTGDMLLKKEVPIREKETDETLCGRLSAEGSSLIVEALMKLEAGELIPQKQNDEESSYAKMITKSMGLIDWNAPAGEIDRQVRGLYSWPGAYTFWQGKLLKIRAASVLQEEVCGEAGTVSDVTKGGIVVNTGEGSSF